MSLERDLKPLPPVEDMVAMVRLLCTPREIAEQPHWSIGRVLDGLKIGSLRHGHWHYYREVIEALEREIANDIRGR